METRYCIEYINPRHPLRENGSLNVRYDRVLTLEQAEHDLTLILSFGGKILDLYMGNVVDGETEEWTPKPMIVDDEDWFSSDWLKSLEVKEVDLEKEIQSWVEDNSVNGYYREDVYETAEHFFELGMKLKNIQPENVIEIKWKPYTEIPTEHWENNPAISPLYLVKCGSVNGNPILGYTHYSYASNSWMKCFHATERGMWKVLEWTDITITR